MDNFNHKKKSSRYKQVFRNIFVCSKNELAPYATVFIHYPENFEQQALGTLFGIIKIDDRSEDSSYITNLLTSVIKKEYFSKPHRTAEESFEASLRKANLALAELVRHGSMEWAGKICYAGGSLERNNLHFSCLGDVSIFLVRHGQIADISQDLEAEKEEETHPLKTFSNISSGKLEIGDKLIFATRELTEIFSSEEIRQNAGHFSFQEFPGFLEISLAANSELAGAVIIDIRDVREEEKTIAAPLFGEETVKKIDSFTGDIEKPLDIVEPLGQQNVEIISKHQKPITSVEKSNKFEFIGNFVKKITEKTKSLWPTVSESISQFSKKIFSRTPKPKKEKSAREKFPIMKANKLANDFLPKAKNLLAKIGKSIKNFDYKKNSLYTGVGISLALIIIVFLIFFAVRNKSNQKSAEQNTAPAQSSEIQANALPADINAKKISGFETLANLSQNSGNIALLNQKIYVLGSKSVFQIDPQTKDTSEMQSNLSTGNFEFLASMPDLSSIFIFTDDKKIISLTPINKNFQENSISLPDTLSVSDIKTYLTYLYILDGGANQIYRYPRAAGGFGDMQSWLKSGVDLRNAKSFAINDDIFTANDLNVIPLLQGKMDSSINFQKPQIPLRIDKIYTEPGFNYIYVLDNTNHRIVEFDKQGKINTQYFDNSIDSVKDFVVDEQNNTVYLLKGNELDKFSLQ